MLMPDDIKLEKWARDAGNKLAVIITRRYEDAAKLIAKWMRELFKRLRWYDKPPAVLNLTPQSLKSWRTAKRQEQLRNSEEVRRSASLMAAVAAFATPLVKHLCGEVHEKNAWHGANDQEPAQQPAEYTQDRFTQEFFETQSSPATHESALQRGFSILLDGVNTIKEYGKQLAEVVGNAARKVINVMHGAAKRAQNWARMQWIRMANAFDSNRWGKMWVTQHDDRVRDSHDPMNGQIRQFDEPFLTAAGNYLMYPGDTSAPIGEWINCRCNLRRVRIA